MQLPELIPFLSFFRRPPQCCFPKDIAFYTKAVCFYLFVNQGHLFHKGCACYEWAFFSKAYLCLIFSPLLGPTTFFSKLFPKTNKLLWKTRPFLTKACKVEKNGSKKIQKDLVAFFRLRLSFRGCLCLAFLCLFFRDYSLGRACPSTFFIFLLIFLSFPNPFRPFLAGFCSPPLLPCSRGRAFAFQPTNLVVWVPPFWVLVKYCFLPFVRFCRHFDIPFLHRWLLVQRLTPFHGLTAFTKTTFVSQLSCLHKKLELETDAVDRWFTEHFGDAAALLQRLHD